MFATPESPSRGYSLALLPLLALSSACARPGLDPKELAALNEKINALEAANQTTTQALTELRTLRAPVPDRSAASVQHLLAATVGVVDKNSYKSGVVIKHLPEPTGATTVYVVSCLHTLGPAMEAAAQATNAQDRETLSRELDLSIATFPGGRETKTPATIVGVNKKTDLMLLATTVTNLTTQPIAVSAQTPAPGTPALRIGCPRGISQVMDSGLFNWVTTQATQPGMDTRLLIVSIDSNPGDSGAPSFCWNSAKQGWELAGIHHGGPVGTEQVQVVLQEGLTFGQDVNPYSGAKVIQAAGSVARQMGGLSLVIGTDTLHEFIKSHLPQ